MNTQVLARRKETLTLLSQQISQNTIVKTLATKYNVNEDALRSDLRRMHKWVPLVLQLEDDAFVGQIVQGILEVVKHSWAEFSKTRPQTITEEGTLILIPPNPPNVRVTALRLALEGYKSIIPLLQSLGKLPKVKEQVDVTGEVTIKLDYGIPAKDPRLYLKKVSVENADGSRAETTELQVSSRETS